MKRFLISLFVILCSALCLSAQDASQNPQKVDKKIHYNTVWEMLRGQSGVIVQNTGSTPKVYIRGVSTNSDNTDPLYVIDGVIATASTVNSLDPLDVDSIEVIKDATAAIYGLRGGNGVIMIKTVTAANVEKAAAEAAKAEKLAAKEAKAKAKAEKKAGKK